MVTFTFDDIKETQELRRKCYNCHETEPPSWRKSLINPGCILCNKCGIYERTHKISRPVKDDNGMLLPQKPVRSVKAPHLITRRTPFKARSPPKPHPARAGPRSDRLQQLPSRQMSSRIKTQSRTPSTRSASRTRTPIPSPPPPSGPLLRLAALDLSDDEPEQSNVPSPVPSVRSSITPKTLADHLMILMEAYLKPADDANFMDLCLNPFEARRQQPDACARTEEGVAIKCLPDVLSAPTLWQVNVAQFPQLDRVFVYNAEIRRQLRAAQWRYPYYWKTFVGFDEVTGEKMRLLGEIEKLVPSVASLAPSLLFSCDIKCTSCDALQGPCLYACTSNPLFTPDGTPGVALICCLGCASLGQSCYRLTPVNGCDPPTRGRVFLRAYDLASVSEDDSLENGSRSPEKLSGNAKSSSGESSAPSPPHLQTPEQIETDFPPTEVGTSRKRQRDLTPPPLSVGAIRPRRRRPLPELHLEDHESNKIEAQEPLYNVKPLFSSVPALVRGLGGDTERSAVLAAAQARLEALQVDLDTIERTQRELEVSEKGSSLNQECERLALARVKLVEEADMLEMKIKRLEGR